MYGLVLAAALTAGASTPDFHHRHGCCGYVSYSACCGYSCCGYGCCGYGFASYYGCCGCYGCYGCYGCCGYSCCGWGGYYGGYVAVVPVAPVYVAPAYYPGCYGCGGYAMASPTYSSIPSTPAPHMNPADVGSTTMAPATVIVKTAKNAKVTVTVDGKPTTLTADETTFMTPILDGSKTYTYVFEASKDGATQTSTQKVTVSAGKKTIVDFSNFATAEVKATTDTAKVTVILPGEGKLYVNDVEMSIKGKQTFETPKLTPGQRYFYSVKADLIKGGKTTSETRRVSIEAGKSITVDFTPSDVLTASR